MEGCLPVPPSCPYPAPPDLVPEGHRLTDARSPWGGQGSLSAVVLETSWPLNIFANIPPSLISGTRMPPGPQGGERHEKAASPGEMARLMVSDSEELWTHAVGPREHSLSRREGKGDTPFWQPTPVGLPGKAHGQRSQSMGSQRAGHTHTHTHTHTRARARAHIAYLGRLLSGASHTSPLLSPASLTRPAQLVWGVSLSPGARQGTGAQEGTQLGTLLWGHEGRRPQPLPRYSRGGSRRPRSLPRTNDRSSLPWLDCRWRSGIGSTIKTRQAWCTGSPTLCCP